LSLPRCSPCFPYTTLFRSLSAVMVHVLAQSIGRLAVFSVDALQIVIPLSPLQLSQRLLIRLGCGKLASQQRVERIDGGSRYAQRSEEHTSELQSPDHLVCR